MLIDIKRIGLRNINSFAMEHVPYNIQVISDRVNIRPMHFTSCFEQVITVAAKKKLEGKICKSGYVRPDSVLVLSRSLGYYNSAHFQGQITFDVELVCDICHPVRGDTIFCEVVNLHQYGLRANAGDNNEIFVYVMREHHSDFFDDSKLREHCHILVEVVCTRCKLNDEKIIVTGKIVRVFEQLALQDYDNKSVEITPKTDIPLESLRLPTSNSVAESKTAFGYDFFIKGVKKILGTAQKDLKDFLLCSSMDEVDESTAERKCGKIYRDARSLMNEFELICPPHSYYSDGLVSPYKPIDRAFFKLWEIIHDFQLLPKYEAMSSQKIVSAHLAESPGAFTEATFRWRTGLHADVESSVDQIFVMSLKSENKTSPGVPAAELLQNRFADYPNFHQVYGGEKEGAIPEGFQDRQGDETGDLFNLGNILDIGADVKLVGGADFVTSDLGFEFSDVEDLREQCMVFPIFAQLVAVLTVQKNGGNAVIKVFDIFTETTAKLIVIMTSFYEEAHLTKPYSSRSGNPEKYLVCKGFRSISKEQLEVFYKLFEDWRRVEPFIGGEYHKNTSFVNDIDGVPLPQSLTDSILGFNHVNVVQRQIRALNGMTRVMRSGKIGITFKATQISKQENAARMWFRKYLPVVSEVGVEEDIKNISLEP